MRHVVFIVVGGLGSITGSILGAVVLTVLPELLRTFKEYQEFVFGGLLLFMLTVLPYGLVSLGAKISGLFTRSNEERSVALARRSAVK